MDNKGKIEKQKKCLCLTLCCSSENAAQLKSFLCRFVFFPLFPSDKIPFKDQKSRSPQTLSLAALFRSSGEFVVSSYVVVIYCLGISEIILRHVTELSCNIL